MGSSKKGIKLDFFREVLLICSVRDVLTVLLFHEFESDMRDTVFGVCMAAAVAVGGSAGLHLLVLGSAAAWILRLSIRWLGLRDSNSPLSRRGVSCTSALAAADASFFFVNPLS